MNGILFIWRDDHYHEDRIDSLLDLGYHSLFCKETTGECGDGIFLLTIEDGIGFSINGETFSKESVLLELTRSNYIIQEVVAQNDKMSLLYPYSLNTIRLVTVRGLKDKKIHIFPSILRIGTNGSIVDNTSQGGLAVGFDLETGQLHEDGFYKPAFGRRVKFHPNSGIRFNDFFIPYIKEAEDLAIQFHSFLQDIHSIGWDIAIGENGPVFIEGNDNWEINGPQVGNRGLRKEFEELFYNYK